MKEAWGILWRGEYTVSVEDGVERGRSSRVGDGVERGRSSKGRGWCGEEQIE